MLEVRTSSLRGTHAVAAALVGVARAGDLIVLAGEMGAGKTAFAQGFGAALGVTEPITSPTFTLVHTYDSGRIDLHHADLYRLEHTTEVADLGLGELLESKGIVLVEWGDVVSGTLGDHLELRLIPDAGDRADAAGEDDEPSTARIIRIRAVGRTWLARWDRLVAELGKVETC